ncbi:MarR family transcriptional regulator [Streptomyces sp. L2]|uniref:MarR family winged helix-turn-helix transcriptional regulator n=1 Tax=Streptomyces sp. L2 TaxID=2162665 RepID=UPI0013E96594|nr:MarR family transcriptional regulator [Streptomyces sp. L2]
MGDKARGPYRSQEAIRTLCAAVEGLESLWERERHSASLPVSVSQLRVLYALERTPEVSLRELGEALDSAPSALSRLCARLEAMGLVRRAPSGRSRREIALHLTGEAKACLRELRAAREQALAAVLDAMTPGARDALVEGAGGLLSALDAAADRAADESVSRSA